MLLVLLLFAAGIALIVAEFFVPGAILGMLGVALLVASGAYAWYTFPDMALYIVLGESVGAVVGVILGFYLVSTTSLGRAMVMEGAQTKDAGYSAPGEDNALVGSVGSAYSALRPAGAILIGDRRIDAVSEGSFIEAGASVRVIEVEGHRVVVEQADGE